MTSRPADVELASRAILDLLSRRGEEKTICPSEAARVLAADGDFRPFMEIIREAAGRLVDRGDIEVLQKGRAVDLDTVRGPVRLRTARSTDRSR